MSSEYRFVVNIDDTSMAKLLTLLKKSDTGIRAVEMVERAISVGLAQMLGENPTETEFRVELDPKSLAILNLVWEVRERHVMHDNRNSKVKYLVEALTIGLKELGKQALCGA